MNGARFVPALPEKPTTKIDRRPAQQHELILHQPVALSTAARSELDRAVSFLLTTGGLSCIVGLGGVLIVVGGWGVPLFSVTALSVFFGVATLVWFLSWAAHLFLSDAGIALIVVLLQYRLLRHEQLLRYEDFTDEK